MSAIQPSLKRILLFAEAVTLAHVARPICFARGLDRSRYRVAIAASADAAPHVAAAGVEHVMLESVSPRAFLSALARGKPLYDAATLRRYVANDREVIRQFAPDMVVGDFRLSLSVSARLAQVPYVSLCSAYWSPFYCVDRWPVPSLPLTRVLPLGIAQAVFSAVRPLAFAAHCGPLNDVRRSYGLPELPRDLRSIYTDADRVAYTDLPELFPTAPLPITHRFIGPALWEPAVPLPEWWNDVPPDRPSIYVNLGSSGDAALLPRIVGALAGLPVSLMVASAGVPPGWSCPEGVFAARYLPGIRAAKRARLVICNGGNLAAYQALAGGALVLGVVGNLDQFLNMQGFERAGAGRMQRADRLSERALRRTVESLLGSGPMGRAAKSLGERCSTEQFLAAAVALVEDQLGRGSEPLSAGRWKGKERE